MRVQLLYCNSFAVVVFVRLVSRGFVSTRSENVVKPVSSPLSPVSYPEKYHEPHSHSASPLQSFYRRPPLPAAGAIQTFGCRSGALQPAAFRRRVCPFPTGYEGRPRRAIGVEWEGRPDFRAIHQSEACRGSFDQLRQRADRLTQKHTAG